MTPGKRPGAFLFRRSRRRKRLDGLNVLVRLSRASRVQCSGFFLDIETGNPGENPGRSGRCMQLVWVGNALQTSETPSKEVPLFAVANEKASSLDRL